MAVTNERYREMVGDRDVGGGNDTPGHIVFRCMKIKRIKDVEGRGRREWVRDNEMDGIVGRIVSESMTRAGLSQRRWI